MTITIRSRSFDNRRIGPSSAAKGTLSVGKVADLCVMDRALGDDVRELEDAAVAMTVVGGRATYDAGI